MEATDNPDPFRGLNRQDTGFNTTDPHYPDFSRIHGADFGIVFIPERDPISSCACIVVTPVM